MGILYYYSAYRRPVSLTPPSGKLVKASLSKQKRLRNLERKGKEKPTNNDLLTFKWTFIRERILSEHTASSFSMTNFHRFLELPPGLQDAAYKQHLVDHNFPCYEVHYQRSSAVSSPFSLTTTSKNIVAGLRFESNQICANNLSVARFLVKNNPWHVFYIERDEISKLEERECRLLRDPRPEAACIPWADQRGCLEWNRSSNEYANWSAEYFGANQYRGYY
jgi:hypothetical protein